MLHRSADGTLFFVAQTGPKVWQLALSSHLSPPISIDPDLASVGWFDHPPRDADRSTDRFADPTLGCLALGDGFQAVFVKSHVPHGCGVDDP